MFYILLSGIGIILLFNYNKIKNKCTEKYNKFQRLNELVATQYKSNWDIFWVSCKIVAKSTYLDIWQTLNKSVKKVNKDLYEITYVLDEQEYKFYVKKKRGPKRLVSVLDEKGNNVTEDVRVYIGPNEDGHGYEITPSMMGYNKLRFEVVGGEIFTVDTHVYIPFYMLNEENKI